ncbi:glycosyl hydrolase family 8 [Flavisphingomonas formosensis]|uniref:glycosyl hydrolase family 8 n=1 Tax=Flavisphingomonas formosensis TaxID=861534 RepID=UPI0012FA1510|nr:glycosyl hydrolase family 8 [Sphingomonas formosensis]
MDVDRRTAMAALLMATMFQSGCAKAAKRPPAAPAPKAWAAFAARFMMPDGRIVDTGNGGISHSEGQGYGMVLAEAAGDRARFEKLWAWTDTTLARKDMRLFSWRYDPNANPRVTDPNNATDGDILIAWALLRASQRWGVAAWASASREIRDAILKTLVKPVGNRMVLLPGLQGFVNGQTVTVNLSYYIWPALDAFRKADGAGWSGIVSDGEAILARARFGQHQLPSDWIDLRPQDIVTPAAGRPPRFGFDAVRIPLYLYWGGRDSALQPFRAYWTPFKASGQVPPAWVDVTTGEVAPYPLSQGAMAIASMVMSRKIPDAPVLTDDYFAAVLTVLSQAAALAR